MPNVYEASFPSYRLTEATLESFLEDRFGIHIKLDLRKDEFLSRILEPLDEFDREKFKYLRMENNSSDTPPLLSLSPIIKRPALVGPISISPNRGSCQVSGKNQGDGPERADIRTLKSERSFPDIAPGQGARGTIRELDASSAIRKFDTRYLVFLNRSEQSNRHSWSGKAVSHPAARQMSSQDHSHRLDRNAERENQGQSKARMETINMIEKSMRERFSFNSESGSSLTYILFDLEKLCANEIALFLLSEKKFRLLMIKATQKEECSNLVVDLLESLIERYGQELERASIGPTQRIITASTYIASTILKIADVDTVGIDSMDAHARYRRLKTLLQSLQPRTLDPTLFSGPTEKNTVKREAGVMDDGHDRKLALLNGLLKPDEPHEEEKPELEKVRALLFLRADAWKSLLSRLYQIVYPDPLEAARDQISSDLLQFATGGVTFKLEWELFAYFEQEIKGSKVAGANTGLLKSLLTISGGSDGCYLNSCETYMNWCWPCFAEMLFEAMENGTSMRKRYLKTLGETQISLTYVDGNFRKNPLDNFVSDPQGVTILAIGDQAFLIAVAQQLMWLAAAFRLPRYDQICYSDAQLFKTKPGSFLINAAPLEEAVDLGENTCWSRLLLGNIIARNFPMPTRRQERGLELPFHLMIDLAGPLEPRLLDEGIYLHGYSRLLFPTASFEPDSIQWHLIAQNDRRDKLQEECIHEYNWLKIRDPEKLATRRTFLGHYPTSVVDLGTEKPIKYYKQILPANADDEHRRPKLPPPIITLGTSGGGLFTATTAQTIVYSKALRLNIDGSGQSFHDILNLAADKPVILYDDSSKIERGWMVPWLLVMLHLAHSWAARNGTVNRALPYIQPLCNPGQEAKRMLKEYRSFILRDGVSDQQNDKKTIEDLFQEFWQALVQREGENLRPIKEDAPGTELSQSLLYGWDYMDIVTRDHACRRQMRLEGSWKALSDKVLVLFGQNFGDVIKPAEGVVVCTQWNPIPTGRGYLTATIRCLQYLSWKKGGPEHCLISPRLLDKAYWHPSSDSLFLDCKNCLEMTQHGSRRCSKDPQEIVSKPKERKESREIPPDEGAVVFSGRKNTLRKAHIPQAISNGGGYNDRHVFKKTLSKIQGNMTTRESSNPSR